VITLQEKAWVVYCYRSNYRHVVSATGELERVESVENRRLYWTGENWSYDFASAMRFATKEEADKVPLPLPA